MNKLIDAVHQAAPDKRAAKIATLQRYVDRHPMTLCLVTPAEIIALRAWGIIP